jgi:Ca-activated chloride channel family protein
MASFDQETEQNKAIIVISDGENHEDNAVEIAEKAAEQGITVHTIGMGSPKGAPIPVINESGHNTGRYKQDGSGNTVITQLNQEMMQRIAKAGNGSYITANNTRVGINKLYDELKTLEAKEFETRVYADYEDRFQYPLALALLLLLLEHLLFNRKSLWMSKIRLFDDYASVKKEDA